MNKINY